MELGIPTVLSAASYMTKRFSWRPVFVASGLFFFFVSSIIHLCISFSAAILSLFLYFPFFALLFLVWLFLECFSSGFILFLPLSEPVSSPTLLPNLTWWIYNWHWKACGLAEGRLLSLFFFFFVFKSHQIGSKPFYKFRHLSISCTGDCLSWNKGRIKHYITRQEQEQGRAKAKINKQRRVT